MGFIGTIAAMDAASKAAKCGAKCDERLVMHHVTNGGCFDDFNKAMKVCRGRYSPGRIDDVEACGEATAALRKCFAGNPAMLEHQYLDQDTKPSEYEIRRDERGIFRWWTGMRRS